MKCYVYTNEWHDVDFDEGSCYTRVFTSKDAAIEAMKDDVQEFERINTKLSSFYDTIHKTNLSAKYYNTGRYYERYQDFNIEEVELEDTGYITLTSDNWIRSEVDYQLENIGADPKQYPELVNKLMDKINNDKYLWDEYSQTIYSIISEDSEFLKLKEELEQRSYI